jgi:undecaprenyl-diphosphatase
MIPGISRSAATILGGLFLGLKRKTAVEFSFLLAVPTMLAATALDLYKSSFNFTPQEYQLLTIGLLGSFFTALLAIKFFLKFIQNHTFIPFGIYRILLAIIFWLSIL